MNVEVILKTKGADVTTISSSGTLASAVTLLCEKKIGAVVVVDNGRVRGILSERDIIKSINVAGAEAMDLPVAQVMTSNVITCTRSDTLDQLMDAMTGGRFRHIPVIEEDELIGIVSIGDVVKHRIAETEMEAEQLRLYIASG
ncbi:MAG TPA: CBS domain-containing protein [Phycisphaerales bacterium]|jgi:CBS domain-containing protein|nr:inosine-5-monophosphate dehydrogenase [Parvibaculum sp.]HIB66246.1 CBS domain-containing protein [Phycisphaerales bacterium]|tara:strand:+ start:220 stop:648 length:429 start_codon:yes stop_codon:yes gene_type:complete